MDEVMRLTDKAEEEFKVEFAKMVDRVTEIGAFFINQKEIAKLVLLVNQMKRIWLTCLQPPDSAVL